MKTDRRGLVLASMALTVIVSLVSLSYRYRAEQANKAVGTLMEGQAVHELAAVSGMTFSQGLTALGSHGLLGVALTEETVADLIDSGELTVTRASASGVAITGQPDSLVRVAQALARKSGLGVHPRNSTSSKIEFDGDLKTLRASSVGIDPADARAAKAAGLLIVARHSNAVGASPAYARDLLEDSRSMGAVAFLPSGEQVLGQRESVEDTAAVLKHLQMDYLSPEFAKIGGDAKMAELAPERLVRLHSMQQAEIDKSTPGGVVDRYSKAFRERNIRWLLLRPISLGGPDALGSTAKFLDRLKSSIESEGGEVKAPRPFDEPGVPQFLFPLLALTAAPWIGWLGRRWALPATVSAALLAAACWFPAARPVFGLIGGVCSPVVAVSLWSSKQPRGGLVAGYLFLCAVSVVGGFLIAGLLNGLPYLIQAKQALGVKAVLMAPVVLVALLMVGQTTTWRDLAKETIRWGPILVGLGLLAAVLVLVVRSGNDAPSAVSDSELRLRALLDKVFYTRPRTKEIAVGFPALWVALALHARSAGQPTLRAWSAVLLVVGSIGLADLVDTLCHLHTPLDIGLARIGIGVVLGGMIGAALWFVIQRFLPRAEASE